MGAASLSQVAHRIGVRQPANAGVRARSPVDVTGDGPGETN
jgi:hypothetical protein